MALIPLLFLLMRVVVGMTYGTLDKKKKTVQVALIFTLLYKLFNFKNITVNVQSYKVYWQHKLF